MAASPWSPLIAVAIAQELATGTKINFREACTEIFEQIFN